VSNILRIAASLCAAPPAGYTMSRPSSCVMGGGTVRIVSFTL